MSYGDEPGDYDNAPTRNEVNRELWEDVASPLPFWFHPPLTKTRAIPSRSGAPSESAGCTEHPNFHAHGDRTAILYWTRRHVVEAHANGATT